MLLFMKLLAPYLKELDLKGLAIFCEQNQPSHNDGYACQS